MTYSELDALLSEAWQAFFITLVEGSGINEETLIKALNRKDCFNGVEDAVTDVIDLECED